MCIESAVVGSSRIGRLAMQAWIFRMACAHPWIGFADDILFLARTFQKTSFMLDESLKGLHINDLDARYAPRIMAITL